MTVFFFREKILSGGDVHSVWIFSLYLYAASAAAAQQTATVGGSKDLTPIRLSRLASLFPCPESQGGESNSSRPTLRNTKGEGGVCGGQSVSRLS